MYLKEVQGLRAAAALLVAVYHIWFHRVSGGVDAFFVITGFFIFKSFANPERQNFTALLKYYQKTFVRVVPSASIVLLSTCLLFYYFDLKILWRDRIESAIAALLFSENYWLAKNGVNYLSQGQPPSPFQQMWALSVQVQIYLLLPVFFIAVALIVRRTSLFALRNAFLGLLALFFCYAVLATHRDQAEAYFSTFARLWEFLAGGCLALWISKIRMSSQAAKVIGYGGLAVLLSFAAFMPVQELFPGFAALIPVMATITIIVAAANGANLRLLTATPMQWLGNISFTFYLWHWPLYILFWDAYDTPEVGLSLGAGIIISAFALAFLTHRIIEKPFRSWRPVNGRPIYALSICAAALLPAWIGAAAWAADYWFTKNRALADIAAVVSGQKVGRMVPDEIVVKGDVPLSYLNGCHQGKNRSSEVIECVYGNPSGDWTVVLVGGSHALQWLPALQKIAKGNPRLRIVSMSKSGCTLTTTLDDISIDGDTNACLEWSRKAVARVIDINPQLIITLATRVDLVQQEIIPVGYREVWNLFHNTPVLAIRDNPRADFDIAACIDRLGESDQSCFIAREDVLREEEISEDEFPSNVVLMDFSDVFCGPALCPPVDNGILRYRDSNHLTATFAASLAAQIEDQMMLEGLLPKASRETNFNAAY